VNARALMDSRGLIAPFRRRATRTTIAMDMPPWTKTVPMDVTATVLMDGPATAVRSHPHCPVCQLIALDMDRRRIRTGMMAVIAVALMDSAGLIVPFRQSAIKTRTAMDMPPRTETVPMAVTANALMDGPARAVKSNPQGRRFARGRSAAAVLSGRVCRNWADRMTEASQSAARQHLAARSECVWNSNT
jgi:hypothetical protein